MAGSLTVVGLGPGGIEHVTVGVLRQLGLGGRLFVRTRRHPAVADLEAMGFRFTSMDDLYESATDYDQLYEDIARRLVAAAQGLPAGAEGDPAAAADGSTGGSRPSGEEPSAAESEVVYAVPGHPTVAERSVLRAVELAREEGVPVKVVAGLSWLDAAWADLLLDPTGLRNLAVVDAKDDQVAFQPDHNYLISHLHHPLVAAELKIRLMDAFPDEHRVVVFQAGGVAEGRRAEIPLHELDRLPWLDHLTSLWVPALAGARDYPLDKLVGVMARLRGEDGCPWDREQTHKSIRMNLIEETYEAVEAI
ncbi:MAG TPA: MazG family protein, partial [Firmicutes bacterium]|nr:MazG family protein [Bacillota bacterium]